ncbi:staphylolytic protease preproenzyme LasA [Formosa agariphila KMM 3901]|uniref:Staphylolytic protease preproenzyme LasA n=1 Tax=Formosa agariphila (strain DSM 15362 / KCTC 12365 / LMG 23005 / KMM 3901 / M-2Alg 35-1) TaxID=1347342 RepID=T2KJP0_FORAG|nr:EcsC family protein [Formosa agariphila]CDF78990.1 staphylolytic protease preproenzyme LasA [Formosa agariphila KMM 3901]
METSLSDLHIQELTKAVSLLENPSIAAKITNVIGMPIEKAIDFLPDNWQSSIGKITQKSLIKATEAAIWSLEDIKVDRPSNAWHKLGAAVSGGVGGFFGLPGLAVELPLSTTIMLRSIADIARSEGELLSDNETKLACMEVFALGGESTADDDAESGYFVVRAALANSITEASRFVATKKISEESAPALVRFIVNVAARFNVLVTEKAAAQAIPAIGAVGGGIINTLFMDHFQNMAQGHFIVRRLERIYSPEEIKTWYNAILELNLENAD